jgi:hypothetical protein
MYGARLTRDFGASVPDPWRSAIKRLKDYELQRGLRRLAAAGSGSPPTLPQFMKACRQVGDDDGPAQTGPALPPASYDFVHTIGQKVLLAYLCDPRNSVDDKMLAALVTEKNRLASDFRQMLRDDEVPVETMRDAWLKAFNRVMNQRAAA